MGKIGIRREDALIYERRCPLIPSHVGELVKQGWGHDLFLIYIDVDHICRRQKMVTNFRC